MGGDQVFCVLYFFFFNFERFFLSVPRNAHGVAYANFTVCTREMGKKCALLTSLGYDAEKYESFVYSEIRLLVVTLPQMRIPSVVLTF